SLHRPPAAGAPRSRSWRARGKHGFPRRLPRWSRDDGANLHRSPDSQQPGLYLLEGPLSPGRTARRSLDSACPILPRTLRAEGAIYRAENAEMAATEYCPSASQGRAVDLTSVCSTACRSNVEQLITLSSPQHHNQTSIQITQVLDP